MSAFNLTSAIKHVRRAVITLPALSMQAGRPQPTQPPQSERGEGKATSTSNQESMT